MFCYFLAIIYGAGTYFHTDFSYSSRYGPEEMFYCQVIVGKYVKGDQNMKVTPNLPNSTTARYDSTVNDEQNPTIFVVYRDSYAYPAYVITYDKQ